MEIYCEENYAAELTPVIVCQQIIEEKITRYGAFVPPEIVPAKDFMEQFVWMKSNPDYVVLVAKEGDSVIGSVMGVICHDLVGDCNPFMVVENVIVRSDLREKGIGRSLMERMEEIATVNMCNYIMFVSRSDRKDAHGFYQSVGYGLNVVQGFKKFL